MKKSLLIAVALISITFTSCKKDWTCSCTDPEDGTVVDIPITNQTKPLAKTACSTYELAGISCKLK
jgi:hypothetical protein